MTAYLRRFGRLLALVGYFGLAVLLVVWHGWLAPPQIMATAFVLAVLLIPLACALPGMVRGRSYTHAWVSLLSLLYFVLAVDGIAAGIEPRWLPAATLTASLALFTGTITYVRARGVLRRRAEAEAAPVTRAESGVESGGGQDADAAASALEDGANERNGETTPGRE